MMISCNLTCHDDSKLRLNSQYKLNIYISIENNESKYVNEACE